MIDSSTVRIEAYGHTINLAPFGYKEVSRYLPIPESSLQYELEPTRKAFAAGDLAAIMRNFTSKDNSFRNWGVYTNRVNTDNFVGTISLAGPSSRNMNTRALACLIMPEGARSKGIGKVAALAVTAVAFHEDAEGMFGWTSERNKGSIGAMEWLGFTHVTTTPYYKFMGNEKSQFWTLLPNDERGRQVMRRLTRGKNEFLEPGWKQYLDRRAHAKIKLNGKQLKVTRG